MTHRTIKALEQLASRPGTTQEGAAAREKLRQAKEKHPHLFAPSIEIELCSFSFSYPPIFPQYWECPCGRSVRVGNNCEKRDLHEALRAHLAETFKPGDRVFYNYWAYDLNCPATVIGMPIPNEKNWGWVRLQFDHLKSKRTAPIFSRKGVHLSKTPLSPFDAIFMGKPT